MSMTREEQKKFRELKKALPKIIQTEIKKYKFKKKDFKVWFQKDELFFDLMLDIRDNDGHCCFISVENVKPMWLDDLLWDILGMPENKNEPISLRAVGAFTVYGSEIYKEKAELVTWESYELQKYVDLYMEHFYKTIQSTTIEKFFDSIGSVPYHEELRKSLSLIHNGQYEEAMDYLSAYDKGYFCNKGIWINDAMRAYCRSKAQFTRDYTG